MTYFTHTTSVEDIKNQYRKLARANHPDLGGDTATMQAINAAYEAALKNANGQTSQRDDGTTWTYHYNPENEAAAMHKILELLALDMPDVEIWLIGTWLWIKGDTCPHKEALGKNGAGCYWSRQRKCWYWKPAGTKSYRSKHSLNSIASAYGAKQFTNEDKRTAVSA